DTGTHELDQIVALGFRVLSHRDRLAEAKDNSPRTDSPAALGLDPTRPQHGDGDDVDAGPEREHERALLEGEQLAGGRAGPLGEDDDGAVVLAEQASCLVEGLDGGGAV